jgi:integrase
MTDSPPPPKRKPKTELESRSFKDGAIYLYRRADYKKPTWFCRVKVSGVKGYVHASTKTTNEHAAYKFADDLYTKSLVKAASGHDLNSRRISNVIDDFVKAHSATKAQKLSVKLRNQFLGRCKEFFGTDRLGELSTAKISQLFDWLSENARGKQLSPNTTKRYATDLKQFLNWCQDRGYLDAVPKFPRIKTEANRRPHFDRKDWNKLTRKLRDFIQVKDKNVARDRKMLREYVLILANTGIRIGEARYLKWSDLREIPSPKGSNQPPEIALNVKGKTGQRTVVSSGSHIKDYFKRILEMRTEELGKKPDNDSYIFCGKDGKAIISFKKSFATLLKFVGIEKDENEQRHTIYSLRHTYATFRLREGVHQFILAKNMGTSTAMLEKHYGHTSSIASTEELTKRGNIGREKSEKTIDWLME